ncbi:MAG: hypothetical protein QNL60_08840 [Flavobacteriales bacterium]|jgi:hypothetical protein
MVGGAKKEWEEVVWIAVSAFGTFLLALLAFGSFASSLLDVRFNGLNPTTNQPFLKIKF